MLRAYFDSASDAIFVLCDEMKFLFCNRIAEEWLGMTEVQLTRHLHRVPITDFLRDPESATLFGAAFAQALEGARRVSNAASIRRTANGTGWNSASTGSPSKVA